MANVWIFHVAGSGILPEKPYRSKHYRARKQRRAARIRKANRKRRSR